VTARENGINNPTGYDRRQMKKMKKPVCRCVVLILTLFGFFGIAAIASSQEMAAPYIPERAPGLSVSASYMHQFDTGLDSSGEFRVDRFFFRGDWKKRQSETFSFGIGINYDFNDYSFSETAPNPIGNPWDQVHTLNLSASSIFTLDKNWKVFVAPSVGVAAESGADWGDAIVYGGIAWTSYRFSPSLALGLGAGVFSKAEEVTAFPVIVIDWKITDRVRLSNPLHPGPTGPAGLEVSYAFDGGSTVAVGGAYRSLRFRLDDSGTVPGGVGEDRAFPLWARFSTKVGTAGTLNFMGGAMVGGKMVLEDKNGNELVDESYDASPFVAATVSFNF
jgi:hypothetical protein